MALRECRCLGDDWKPMADTSPPESEHPGAKERRSVLAELPNTRPQRASARRESARRRARSTEVGPKPAAAKAPAVGAKEASAKARPKPRASNSRPTTAPSAPTTAPTRARRTGSRGASALAPTPRQGYEADHDLTGTSVSPPSGAEVLGSLAELAGELAHNGITAGGRLLKGALSRLSGS
jgi:hypothetical protein